VNITIKPSAVIELKKYELKEEEGVRVEAIFIGSCSIYAEYNLKIDVRRNDDELYIINDIPILVSIESQKHLHQNIYIDFNPTLGFKLSSDEEVYRYNLKVTRM
jgi:Fe-S cluster assembly iron-binding protein IscA